MHICTYLSIYAIQWTSVEENKYNKLKINIINNFDGF